MASPTDRGPGCACHEYRIDHLYGIFPTGVAASNQGDLAPETQELAGNLALILDDAFNLLLRKHENYGPSNIAAAPGGALNGLRVRLHDKQARWNHMLDNNKKDQVGEDLEETFLDALNYCAISILVLRGQWPGVDAREQ